MKNTIVLLLVVSICFACKPFAQTTQFSEMTTLDQFGGPSSGVYKPNEAEKKRIAWFREAKFGMFMHWGLYAQMAGYWKGQLVRGGEWAIKLNKLPIEEYRDLTKVFNPSKFNADEWVKLIKAAGMKYLVITAKHHDGFAMFRSKASAYNIVDATPFKRDPMQELKAACDKHGIRFGLYYSHGQDWNEPDAYGNNWSFPNYKRDMNKYLDEKAIPQIKELCEQYQPAIMWFDTAGDITEERANQIAGVCRGLVPNILINSRILLGKPKGLPLTDFDGSGDNEAFREYHNVPWELCGTMNKSWAYKKWDTAFRPVNELLYNLIDAVSKNGNYLLNVGPTAEGIIAEPYAVRLRTIGEWLKVNGEAIYGCNGTVWGTEFGNYAEGSGKRKFVPAPANWRCTSKPGVVYIHVLNWPQDGKIVLPTLKNKVQKAVFLAKLKGKIGIEQTTDSTILTLPPTNPNNLPVVLKLTL